MQTTQDRTKSQSTSSKSQFEWEDISQPGTYVEVNTGRLVRIPPHALQRGSSPVIAQQSNETLLYKKLSPDPYITTEKAALLAAQVGVPPTFADN
jgi:hypothetical protein